MNLLVTNHAHVLARISKDPSARMRDLAAQTGLTERAVQRLVNQLEEGGFLRRVREGRRNRYEVLAAPLRTLAGSLLALVPLEQEPEPVAPLAPGEPSMLPVQVPPGGLADSDRRYSFVD